MSAIAGIFARTTKPVTQERLLHLSRTLEQAGPDGEEHLLLDRIGLLHRPFHTSSMSRRTPQPVASPNGAILLWNGRLDNRSELFAALDPTARRAEVTDAALVLSAYEKWGTGFPGRLIGDFALAIWDPKAQNLLLARDPFGIRTLFYNSCDEEIIFSSTLDSMLRAGGGELTLDEDFIADYLSTTSFSNKTPFQQIKAVPPGFTLCFDPDRQSQVKYWQLDPSLEISYNSDEEYEEHFRELFFDAVRSRLPDSGPVCSELSGGLDSSSIVCVADAILREQGQSGDRLKTLSYVFEQAPSSDESGFIRCVEEHIGRPGIHLSEIETPLLAPISESTLLPFPSPDHLFSRRQTAAREVMDQAGARVLLRGTAGDHVAWGEVVQPYELADHLSKGHFGAFFKALRAWSQSLRVPYLQLSWNAGILPLLPRKLQKYSARTVDRQPAGFFLPEFVRRQNLTSRMLGTENAKLFTLPSRQQHHQFIQDAAEQVSWGFFLESGTIETTYPFLHRPLVEFCMAIDMNQKLRPGETRSILRRSLREYLPDPIRKRQSKRGPDEAILRALAQRADFYTDLFKNPRVEAYGYVDARKAREALQLACHGRSDDSVSLTDIIALELWIRSIERNVSSYQSPNIQKEATQEVRSTPRQNAVLSPTTAKI